MRTEFMPVAWYWFRASFRRRWTNYLTIALLIGLVGGVAIGSVGAARRTESSFNVFLVSTNPSDMSVLLYAPKLTVEYLTAELSHLPLVQRVGTVSYEVTAYPAGLHGAPRIPAVMSSGDVAVNASLKDEYFSLDKLAVTNGRLANPRRTNEFVMTAVAERLMGWQVGQAIPMYFYTQAQSQQPAFGTAKVRPHLRLTMHLVGTVVLNNEVVLDEVDRYPTFIIFTPALTRQLVGPTLPSYSDYSLKLHHGASDVPAVEREIIAALPKGTFYSFHVTSDVSGQVDRSIEPEAIALGVFGLIALLAALIIAGGLVARALQSDDNNINIMRALGGDPSMTASASLLGVLGAIVTGAVLAVGVAAALSPLSPIGPVHAVYPNRGFDFDWPVLGLGFAILVAVLGAIAAILLGRRRLPSEARPRRLITPVGSKVAKLVAVVGLPVTAVVGVRFAIEPGRDRDAVPVRSALLGAVLAVMIVVATLTFGNSLNTLISHPALYGWNWNYALSSSGGIPPASTRLLTSDHDVAAWSGIGFASAEIDGVTLPEILVPLHAAVSPPLLSGHEVDAANQIVLGAATMKQLHKHVGDTVIASFGSPKDAPIYVAPTRLVIVGTATLPAVGQALTLHTSMGTGAIMSAGIEPAAMHKYLASPYPTLNGPEMVFVRLRSGVSRAQALASLQKIATVGDRAFAAVPNGQGSGDSVAVLKVQYPAEIENYRSIGATPAVLALALAAGAVVALGLTLAASVRRRRRDLALLRTLGFTRRQLTATVAWQASVAGVTGIVFGEPLGIVLGRWLWTLFARGIYAVPAPTVPVLSVVVVALGALVLVNIVATLPGRSAARTSTAEVLRGE